MQNKTKKNLLKNECKNFDAKNSNSKSDGTDLLP